MAKTTKTNAARLLDKAGVHYELAQYAVSEEDLSADHVARETGADIARVFKTLILRGDRNGVFVCVIPGDREVDLKKAAAASGNKSAAMIALKELQPLTGYIRGGCSPVGMKRPYPTFIDEKCRNFDTVYVSAGVRGTQFVVDPRALASCLGATVTELT